MKIKKRHRERSRGGEEGTITKVESDAENRKRENRGTRNYHREPSARIC